MPVTRQGNASSIVMSQYDRASREEFKKPSDSSSGVVCALPTMKSPFSLMMKVSVMVPPASIARILGAIFRDMSPSSKLFV